MHGVLEMSLQDIAVPDIGDFKDVIVAEVKVNPGDSIEPNDTVVILETEKPTVDIHAPMTKSMPVTPPNPPPLPVSAATQASVTMLLRAGPAVRRFARELGVDLHAVTSTGPRGRL